VLSRDEIVHQLLAECEDDHVGLWQLVNCVRLDLDVREPEEVRRITLELVCELLKSPGIEVGFPASDGRQFVAWDLPPEEAVRRIQQEWNALARPPDIGEIAWFSSRPAFASGPAK
jgi:hypothetical protein